MKLNDISSKDLLPRFASYIEWVQNAFDVIVKAATGRAVSIDAPLTMEAIEALTDEELQALYEQYGIAVYYPDLTRETRNQMLYEMCKIYRYLGTPHAIETLCDYIFDGVSVGCKVIDNQAFDDAGELIKPGLLDLFDIEINPSLPVLDPFAHARLLENIIHFSRNSIGLHGINYDFPEDFALPVYTAIRDNNPVVCIDVLNDAICEPFIPPVVVYSYIVLDETTGETISGLKDSFIMVTYRTGDLLMPATPMVLIEEV